MILAIFFILVASTRDRIDSQDSGSTNSKSGGENAKPDVSSQKFSGPYRYKRFMHKLILSIIEDEIEGLSKREASLLADNVFENLLKKDIIFVNMKDLIFGEDTIRRNIRNQYMDELNA